MVKSPSDIAALYKKASTAGQIKTELSQFAKWVSETHQDPELLTYTNADKWFQTGNDQMMKDIVAFCEMLKDGSPTFKWNDAVFEPKTPKSRQTYRAWISVLLRENNLRMDPSTERQLGRLMKGSSDYVPSCPRIKEAWRILNNLPLAFKAFFILQLSLGARFEEIHGLLLTDLVELPDGYYQVTFRSSETKAEKLRFEFPTAEACLILKQWLIARSFDPKRLAEYPDNVFFFSEETIRSYFDKALMLSGFKTDAFREHSLRAFFVTYGKQIVGIELIHAMAGHGGGYMKVYEVENANLVRNYFRQVENILTLGLSSEPLPEPKLKTVMVEREQEIRRPMQVAMQQTPTSMTYGDMLNEKLAQPAKAEETPRVFAPLIPKIVQLEIPKMPSPIEDVQASNQQSQQSNTVGGLDPKPKETANDLETSSNQQREPTQEELTAFWNRDVQSLQEMRKKQKDGDITVDDLESMTRLFAERWGRENLLEEDEIVEKNLERIEEDVQQTPPQRDLVERSAEVTDVPIDSNMKVTDSQIVVQERPQSSQQQPGKKTPVYTESFEMYIDWERVKKLKEQYGDAYAVDLYGVQNY